MISCIRLEKPGKWRSFVVAVGLSIAVAPVVPLLWAAFTDSKSGTDFAGSAFVAALRRGFTVAAVVAVVSFLAGLPTGLILALHEFALRRVLGAALALPLLLPSFLLAIGLSMFRGTLGLSAAPFFSGFPATVATFAAGAIPLVTLLTLGAARGITRGQAAAARLAGGEVALFRYATRAVWPLSALAAAFAGILTLSEPGPGQIFGYHGAASEILTSFSAQYDFGSAARQCLMLTAVVAAFALPCAALLSPILSAGLLARDAEPAEPKRTSIGALETLGMLALLAVMTGLPLTGLLLPLARDFPLGRAVDEAARTFGHTLFYDTVAAVLATSHGFALALAAGREHRLRVALVTGLLVLFALPPALSALGWVRLATQSPSALDSLMRDRPLLAVHLGLRLLPVAAVFALRAVGTASPSWVAAAAIHGVSVPLYLRRVLVPWAWPALSVAGVLVALLAMADITSALLLHPPGKGTVPLSIFTVMANAPESFVAALCLVYVGGAAIVAALAMSAIRLWREG